MFGQGRRRQGGRPGWTRPSNRRRGFVTANEVFPNGRKLCSALLLGTIISGFAAPAAAQTAQPPAAPPAPGPAAPGIPALPTPPVAVQPQPTRTVASLAVTGNQRLEPETVLSYTSLPIGEAQNPKSTPLNSRHTRS